MNDQMTALRKRLDALEGSTEGQLENVVYDLTESVVARMGELRISRSDLARRLGVSRAMVTKMLRGNTNFTLRTLVELGRALECRLAIQLPPCGFQTVPFFVSAEPSMRRSYGVPVARVQPRSVPYPGDEEVHAA
jgi:transcriptional regulator with XRE-family HTH domain